MLYYKQELYLQTVQQRWMCSAACYFLYGGDLPWQKNIIKLKWKDVFVDRGQYRLAVSMKKTKEPIYLPLSPEALKWMPERGGKSSEDNVFDLPSANTIRMQLKPWAKAAGISKRFSYHTSRHTFATMMLTLGADLYTVSKLLGHADVKMTQVYAKIINKKKDEAVNLVNGLFH